MSLHGFTVKKTVVLGKLGAVADDTLAMANTYAS